MKVNNLKERDPLFDEVKKYVQEQKIVSVSAIQRRFCLGFNRAGNILDSLEKAGIVSEFKNGKREVL